ncbi:MAG: FHA domain-containing protein [Pirellulales bacterium]
MAMINLRVLDGADRGRVFGNLTTPVTIGREEGNVVQLNDERVSRYHLKIQEDQQQYVLTDLDSTNGTKVNGEDVSLRILRYGDIISVGRSVLLFGSREEIAERLIDMQGEGDPHSRTLVPEDLKRQAAQAGMDYEEHWSERLSEAAERKIKVPPPLPQKLSPLQSAQLCEVLEFCHVRLREVLAAAKAEPAVKRVVIDEKPWQNLIDLQWRLAEYARSIAEPKSEEE